LSSNNVPLHSASPPQQPIVSRAKLLAYKTGIRELEEVVRRIESLEAKVAEQGTVISTLQSTVLALKHPGHRGASSSGEE
jgi:hypothetical protein